MSWKMKLPIFGKLVRLNLFGQFARTLSTLLKNGVPVLTALKITEQVMPNQIHQGSRRQSARRSHRWQNARPAAGAQQSVSAIDGRSGQDWRGNRRRSGALGNLADTYEGELQIALRAMTNLIEPS